MRLIHQAQNPIYRLCIFFLVATMLEIRIASYRKEWENEEKWKKMGSIQFERKQCALLSSSSGCR